jgi:hypothetical protein
MVLVLPAKEVRVSVPVGVDNFDRAETDRPEVERV